MRGTDKNTALVQAGCVQGASVSMALAQAGRARQRERTTRQRGAVWGADVSAVLVQVGCMRRVLL